MRRDGGSIDRTRMLERSYGVPGAAYDGSTTGLSADGRTLVLADAASPYRSHTPLIVLDAGDLRVRRHIDLYQSKMPFIHALDTSGRTARCIDLAARASANIGAERPKLVGPTLVVSSAAGPQALVDTRTFKVGEPKLTPSRPAPPAREPGGGGPPGALALLAAPVLFAGVGLVARRRRRPPPLPRAVERRQHVID